MSKYVPSLILAALVGFVAGLQGHVGSMYMLTGLLLFGIVDNQRDAAGLALIYGSVALLGAAISYYQKTAIDKRLIVILVVTGFIFSTLGARVNFMIPPKYNEYSIAFLMILSGGYFMRRAYVK